MELKDAMKIDFFTDFDFDGDNKMVTQRYRYLIKLAKSKKMKSADVGALYIRSA